MSKPQSGRFVVGGAPGAEAQVLFAASHPGVAGTPVVSDRVLAYITIRNVGPRAVRVFWDEPPPTFQSSPSNQATPLLPGNTITIAVGRAAKIVYAPDVDPTEIGDTAVGTYVIAWCCPPTWDGAALPETVPPPPPALSPTVEILPLPLLVFASPVSVRYVLKDDRSEPLQVSVSFAIGGASTLRQATRSLQPGSDPLIGAQSSPTGVQHVFLWDAATDLGGHASQGVILRFEVSTGTSSGSATTSGFSVGALTPPTPTTTPPPPAPPPLTIPIGAASTTTRPEVMIPPLEGMRGPIVPIWFLVSDPNNERVDVDVEFAAGTSGFDKAAAAPTSDRMSGLAAPSNGRHAAYRFMWDLTANNVQKGTARIRITPKKAGIAGTPGEAQFDVDPAPPAGAPLPYQDKLPVDARIEIFDGDQQAVVSGCILSSDLRVRVRDDHGNVLSGVRISFVVATGSPPMDIVPSANGLTATTEGNGAAGVRVRVRPGARGTGSVEARIVGKPKELVTFTFTIQTPKLEEPIAAISGISDPTTAEVYGVSADYRGDGGALLSTDGTHPIRLAVTATSGVWAPSEAFLRGRFATVLVWGARGSAASITFTDPREPTIGGLTLNLPVVPAYEGPMRQIAIDQWSPADPGRMGPTGLSRREPMHLALKPPAALPAQPVGYAGVTLGFPVPLRIEGPGGATFDEQVTQNNGCGALPVRVTQQVHYTEGYASGGFSTSATSTGTDQLTVDVGQPVWFTPRGPGPWAIAAWVVGSIYDPTNGLEIHRKDTELFDPSLTGLSDHDVCYQEHSVGGLPPFFYLIHGPRARLVLASDGTIVKKLRIGDRVRIEVPCNQGTAATPRKITIAALEARGYAPQSFSGAAPVYALDVTLNRSAAGTELVSDEILITSGNPEIAHPAAHVAYVIPGGGLRVYSDALDQTFEVASRADWRRDVVPLLDGTPGTVESMYESPAGTTPMSGAVDSVALHTGELIYRTLDLSLVTRAGDLELRRTYRSHLHQEGMLGPGWSFGLAPYLDVARISLFIQESTTLLDGDGRLHDFAWGGDSFERGAYWNLVMNGTVDDEHGAYQLTDFFGNDVHFNVDGSIRFLRDKLGNKTSYVHDENGHLIGIVDVHGRRTKLDYWGRGETTPDGAAIADDTIGKLKTITDWTGERRVDLEYYVASGGDGAPGWLKTVTMPTTPAINSLGQRDDRYRRKETYRYTVDAADRLNGRLREVVDAEGLVVLSTHYDGHGRVDEQRHAGTSAPFRFRYGPAPATPAPAPPAPAASPPTMSVTDPEGNEIEYTFGVSPFWQAATPTKVALKQKPTAGGAPPDLTYDVLHDESGHLVRVTSPAGDQTTFAYDSGGWQPAPHPFAVRRVATTGAERVWTFNYGPYWQRANEAGPRGQLVGSNPEMYRTYYTFDAKGRVEKLLPPSSLTMTGIVLTTGLRQRWITRRAAVRWAYNDFGQIVQRRDPNGIVTEYRYYPNDDPTGAEHNSTATTVGGGLLGEVEQDIPGDATATNLRDTYLPNTPYARLKSTCQYNKYGHIVGLRDARGTLNKFEPNALGDVQRVTFAAETSTSIQGAPVIRALEYDWRGLISSVKLEGTGYAREWKRDELGDITGTSVAYGQGTANERFVRNAAREVAKYRPPELESGLSPSSGAELERDGRTLPKTLREGSAADLSATTSSALFETGITFSSAGALETITNPVGETHRLFQGDFGDTVAATDAQGNGIHAVSDFAGIADRLIEYTGDGTPKTTLPDVSAQPVRRWSAILSNELGDSYRFHEGLFVSSVTAGAPTNVQPPPEHLADVPAPPLPAATLKDGKWGADDALDTTDLVRDTSGLLSRIVGDDLDFTLIQRDPRGRPTQTLETSGDTVTYAYEDPFVTVRSTEYSSDPALSVSNRISRTFEYDAFNRVVRTFDGKGCSRRFAYNTSGFLVATSDCENDDLETVTVGTALVQVNKEGNVTRYGRDGMGRVTSIELALAASDIESFVYNTGGTVGLTCAYHPDGGPLQTITDHESRATRLEYDAYGRLKTIVYPTSVAAPNANQNGFEYDAKGRPHFATDANGTKLRYEHDDQGRRTGIHVDAKGAGVSANVGDGLTFVYEAEVTIATDLRTSYVCRVGLDSVGRIKTETQGVHVVEREHNASGTTLKYPKDSTGAVRQVRYEYDEAGRLVSVADGVQGIASYVYLGKHRVREQQLGAVRSVLDYEDGTGWLLGVRVEGLATLTEQSTLLRDRSGRIKSRSRTYAGSFAGSKEWRYDAVGRIVYETFTPPPNRAPGPILTQRFYDGDGVLRKQVRSSGPASAVSQTELQNTVEERGRVIVRTDISTGTSIPMRYDRNGNLLDDGIQQYGYDAMNRLVQVTRGTTIVTYEYDPLDRCISRTVNGTKETYVYDGWNLIQVRVGDDVKETYIYTDGLDELLMVQIGTARYRYLYTPERYIDALVDDLDSIVERYDYDLQGRATVLDAFGNVSLDASGNPDTPRSRFLFQRRPFDSVTGLYEYRLRWYNPELGSFVSADPAGFGQGVDHYGLNHGDPVNFTDASGLDDQAATPPPKAKRAPFVPASVWDAWWDGFCEGAGDGAMVVANAATLGLDQDLSREANERARQYGRVGTAMKWTAGIGVGAAYVAGGLLLADGLGVTSIGTIPLSQVPGVITAGVSSLAQSATMALGRFGTALMARFGAGAGILMSQYQRLNYFMFRTWYSLEEVWCSIPGRVRALIDVGSEATLGVSPSGTLMMGMSGGRGKYDSGRGSFRDSTKERLQARFPELHDEEGLLIPGNDRRHVVADSVIRRIISWSLNRAGSDAGRARLLRTFGFDPEEYGGDLKAAARAWQLEVFNYSKNLWVGPSVPNQDKGRGLAAGDRNTIGTNAIDPNPSGR